MKRILVLGSGGAGKSTITEELHKILRLPIIRLDEHYWHPGWVRPEHDEWEKKVQELIQNNEWIIDGNYQSTLYLRIPRADAVIFMDAPRLVCLARLIRRRITKPNTIVAPGCVERLDRKFMSYIWNYRKTHRPEIMEILEKYKNEKQIHIIRSEREMWKFLKTLKN
ncbi:MAG: AAA family ATPase [Patescibacteria group bacterium]